MYLTKRLGMNFEVLSHRSEIIKAIESCSLKSGMIWQSSNEKRVIKNFTHIEVSLKHSAVAIELECLDGLDRLNPLYIRLEHRNTVFKTKIIVSEGRKLLLRLPTEVTVEELRQFKRHQVSELSKKPLLIKTFLEDEAIPVVLDEVSQSGLGVYVSEEGIIKLNSLKSEIFVDKIGKSSLKKEVKLELVYAGKIEKGRSHLFKVGMKFDDLLSKDFVHEFIFNEPQKNLYESNLLQFGKIFKSKLKNKIIEQQDFILKKNNFFELFDLWQERSIKEDDPQFISYYVHSISILSAAFARLANIIGHNSYLQLVYVSYIDALPFYRRPELLKYKNKYTVVRDSINLTEVEKQLVFESRDFSHKYSLKDVFAPIDSEKLLGNLAKYFKHEKPKKFLNIKKNDHEFLSFFFAKEFFFYTMENKIWSFEDFVLSEVVGYFGEDIPLFLESLKSLKKSA